jgi:hypothetical protein
MKKWIPVLLVAVLLAAMLVLPAAADGPVTSLVVTKTVTGHWDRYLDWTVEKEAVPESVDIFVGDEQEIKYDVTVSQVGYTDVYRVSGQIVIENDCSDTDDKTAYIEYVDDAIEYNVGGTWIEFHRERIRGEFTIPTCGTEYVDYDFEFTPPAGVTQFRNVAHVGLTNHAPPPGVFKDFLYRATFNLPSSPTLHDECVDVSDSYAGYLGQVCGEGASQTFTYYRTVSYDAPGTYYVENTATADGQQATKKVTVKVWDLDVSKDADTSFNRYWTWTIDKTGDQTELTLSVGQQFLVNYSVTVGATSTDDDWAVNGTISVMNPAPMAAMINSVSDVVSDVGAASVDCGVSFPYSLAAGGTLNCTYSADLPNANSRTNTATATLQNYAYDYQLNATPDGTTDFSGTAGVAFGTTPADEIDECIDVSDTYAGFLGTVCYGDAPKTFTYSRWIGPYDTCGDYTVENTASFVTNDTSATDSDGWTVTVHVPCVGGCTLTPGYWKTHSEYGPAPYDDTWASIGEDTPFFLSGQTYYEVLWTPPTGGNAYYILAHAYIAAELNFLNGADPSAAQDAFDEATDLFNTYTPEEVAGLKGKVGKELRAQFIDLAEILDDYNNGYIGPGHCSE